MTTMSISVFISARNEAATIGELVRAVVAQPGLSKSSSSTTHLPTPLE